jgi:hypothetical protein
MLVAWFQTKRMRNKRQPLWILSEGTCTEVSKETDYQLTTCSTCTVEGKCGRKMGSTLGPNRFLRARVIQLTHLNSFPFLCIVQKTYVLIAWHPLQGAGTLFLIHIQSPRIKNKTTDFFNFHI